MQTSHLQTSCSGQRRHEVSAVRSAAPSAPMGTLRQIFPQFEEIYCSADYLSAVLENRFEISGETHSLGSPVDWLTNPSIDIEWHIVLHKFYFAPGLARAFVDTGRIEFLDKFAELIDGWIDTTPIGYIAADVTARRVQNWLYAWHVLRSGGSALQTEFERKFRASLCEQVEFVARNLAPSRNHRTLELYSMFLAAVMLADSARAAEWLELATTEMSRNIETDLLADGVHCELSTDYHHIVLKNYLLFVRTAHANRISVPEHVYGHIERALEFAMHVHRPDGKIPALSDSDSRSYLELLEWGGDLLDRPDFDFVATGGERGIAPDHCNRAFRDSGYAVLRSAWAERPFVDARYLVFDAGPIGAGNHGHLDALSFEAFAFGQPLVVDPGRYTYDEAGPIDWRGRFRGTAAHNTVVVDGLEQARYERKGGGRKKIRAPHPHLTLDANCAARVPILSGTCRSANYAAVHTRHILFPDRRFWWIADILEATNTHHYELGFQLGQAAAAGVDVIEHPGGIEFHAPGVQLLVIGQFDGYDIVDGYISSEYGEKRRAPRVVVRRRDANTALLTLLWPYRETPARLACSAGSGSATCAIDARGAADLWLWESAHGRLQRVRAAALTEAGRISEPQAWVLDGAGPC